MTNGNGKRSRRVFSLKDVEVTSADGGSLNTDQDLFRGKLRELLFLKLHFPWSTDNGHRVGLGHLCLQSLRIDLSLRGDFINLNGAFLVEGLDFRGKSFMVWRVSPGGCRFKGLKSDRHLV